MTALTLGEMHQLRWKLIATCSCGLAMRASVPMLIRVHGPDAVWWGVHPPCPSLKCDGGRLTYSAQSINGGSWTSMARPPSQLAVTRWKNSRGEHPGPR